jgi:hypothetical protein
MGLGMMCASNEPPLTTAAQGNLGFRFFRRLRRAVIARR